MTPKTLTLEQCVTFTKAGRDQAVASAIQWVNEAEVSEFELQTFANLCVGIVGEKREARVMLEIAKVSAVALICHLLHLDDVDGGQ